MVYNHKTWVEISKSALENNVKRVKKLLQPSTKLAAVIKSNAYGHGLTKVAKILSGLPLGSSTSKYLEVELPSGKKFAVKPSNGVDWLGVDSIDEAITLRKTGIKTPILVLGYTSKNAAEEAILRDIRLTVYDTATIKKVAAKLRSVKGISDVLPLHIKIDTGMSRQGILVDDLPGFLGRLPRGLHIEGVFTHFANADNLRDRSYANFQLSEFKRALKILAGHAIEPRVIHAAATTSMLTMPSAHLDMVRVGIALYGLWPSVEFYKSYSHIGLRPVLSWKTRIVQIKKIKAGMPVGYGITERVATDTRVGIIPVGYYDGLSRSLSSVGHVLVHRQKCKILGRLSMNLTVVDLMKAKRAETGDEVVLIGNQGRESITAEEIAQKTGTISYEVVSRINPLLPRILVY